MAENLFHIDLQNGRRLLSYIKEKYRSFYQLFFDNVYLNDKVKTEKEYDSFIRENTPNYCLFNPTSFTDRHPAFHSLVSTAIELKSTVASDFDGGGVTSASASAKSNFNFETVDEHALGLFDLLELGLDKDTVSDSELLQTCCETFYNALVFGTVMDLYEVKQVCSTCILCKNPIILFFHGITLEALHEICQHLRAHGTRFKIYCVSIIFNPIYMLSFHLNGNSLQSYRTRYLRVFSNKNIHVKYASHISGLAFIDKVIAVSSSMLQLSKVDTLYRFYYLDDYFIFSEKCLSKMYYGVVPPFVVRRDMRIHFDYLPSRALKFRCIYLSQNTDFIHLPPSSDET